MKDWARRASELHDELAEIADVRDPRWWLVAGGAAVAWQQRADDDRGTYVASDAEPGSDTFIGHLEDAPKDPLADALVRAHAARVALRELDDKLPGQRLAVTVERNAEGAVIVPSALDIAAFAVGDRVITHRLADRIEDETGELRAAGDDGAADADAVPFVTITIGDEPIETARHGHRRAWTANGNAVGPWLGLGRASGLAVVSTCHMVVDGYGHAWLAAKIAEHAALLRGRLRTPPTLAAELAPPKPIAGAIPLGVTWKALPPPAPRALQLAYALGRVLHRLANKPDAQFSPTFQIPVAPGAADDPQRIRRRVIPAIASVRFDHGTPEPFDVFAERTRKIVAREATGDGLVSRLLTAARAVPGSLAWKRRAVGPGRPRWLEPVADVIGGRGCVSKIKLDVPAPPSCAVSSPARLASESDELGGCVVTVIDDGTHAAITWCGSGRAGGTRLLDELLELL